MLVCAVLAMLGFFAAFAYYSVRLEEAMVGRRWELPSKLYPSALTLELNQRLPPGRLSDLLESMGYLDVKPVRKPGEYRRAGTGHYYLRVRSPWAGLEQVSAQTLDLRVTHHVLTGLRIHKGANLKKAVIPPVPFAELRGPEQETRKLVTYESLPKHLIQALVAIEDKRFFQHRGIDPRGLARAIYVNLMRSERAQGGSTLSQQLAKNYFLTHEKTIRRKVKEVFYALALERKFSKEEILELYLNEIYFGQRGGVAVSGVGQAAYAFFSKEVQQLSLEDSALLAGMIQAPNAYAPDRHPERAKKRRNVVLNRMATQGFIDDKQHEAAIKAPLNVKPGAYVRRTAPYFVDYVTDQLSESVSMSTFRIEGYTLETTLDMRVQVAAEKALQKQLARLDKKSRGPLEGAVVALDPGSGRILAMVGGRNYGTSQFNRASMARRQPGSLLKPLVILAALQARGEEISPGMQLLDEALTVTYGGKHWSPKNYDRKYRGWVTLRETLELSLNVPIVRLANEIGFQRISSLLRDLEIPQPRTVQPSIVLGATEMTPLQVASAFTAIATTGILHPPYGLERVLDRDGQVIYDHRPEALRVARAADVYIVRDMMRGVLERGTGRSVRRLGYGFEASGKTGTTNDFKDAWFVGFDPELLVVVWVGSDRAIPIGLTGGKAALPIWVDVMKAVRADDPPPEDVMPPALTRVSVCAVSREKPSKHCPETIEEIFWKGREPNLICRTHGGPLEDLGSTLKQRLMDFLRRRNKGMDGDLTN